MERKRRKEEREIERTWKTRKRKRNRRHVPSLHPSLLYHLSYSSSCFTFSSLTFSLLLRLLFFPSTSSSPTFPARLLVPSLFSCFCLIIFTRLFSPPASSSPPLLSPALLFDSFFKSLPNSRVLPQRLFVCTSIIPGDKRRPFHRSHANLKPDTLTFLFLFIFASCFLWSERSLRQVDVKFLFLLSVEINTLPPTEKSDKGGFKKNKTWTGPKNET